MGQGADLDHVAEAGRNIGSERVAWLALSLKPDVAAPWPGHVLFTRRHVHWPVWDLGSNQSKSLFTDHLDLALTFTDRVGHSHSLGFEEVGGSRLRY